MIQFNGEPLTLAMRRFAKGEPFGAIRNLLELAANELDRLDTGGVDALDVRAWLEANGLDVHPRQKRKFKQLCDDA